MRVIGIFNLGQATILIFILDGILDMFRVEAKNVARLIVSPLSDSGIGMFPLKAATQRVIIIIGDIIVVVAHLNYLSDIIVNCAKPDIIGHQGGCLPAPGGGVLRGAVFQRIGKGGCKFQLALWQWQLQTAG